MFKIALLGTCIGSVAVAYLIGTVAYMSKDVNAMFYSAMLMATAIPLAILWHGSKE